MILKYQQNQVYLKNKKCSRWLSGRNKAQNRERYDHAKTVASVRDMKSYMKSKPVETNRTISSIFNIEGMLMHVCHIVMTLCKDLDKRLNLDHDKNPMIIDSKDWDDE